MMSQDSVETKIIQNIGKVPHNLSPSELMARISCEIQNGNEVSILTIKPEFYPTDPDGFPIQKLVEGLLTSTRSTVISTSEKQLALAEVMRLYKNVLENEEGKESPEWLVNLRSDLINYITSGTVFNYLIVGQDAVSTTTKVKSIFRQYLKSKGISKLNVRNIIHSPDSHEISMNLEILFNIQIQNEQ